MEPVLRSQKHDSSQPEFIRVSMKVAVSGCRIGSPFWASGAHTKQKPIPMATQNMQKDSESFRDAVTLGFQMITHSKLSRLG